MGTLRLGSSVVVPSVVNNISTPVIDPLSITPTTSQQTITAPSGTNGYSPITVDAVTSSIDANIVAGNIKKDVEILGVTGTYEGSGGNFVGIPKVINNGVLEKGSTINLGNATALGNGVLQYAFYQNNSVTTVDLSGITSLGVNSLANAFNSAHYLNTLDLSDLVYVTDSGSMAQMCEGCNRLVNVHFDNLKQIGTDYISTGTMRRAFYECTSLVSLDFPSLEGIHGSNTMFYMCYGCTSLQTIYFRSLTSTGMSNYGDYMMYNMLNGCSSVTVHFPSNLQSVIGSLSDVTSGFGGTNTTVLFDLPATE